MHTEKKKPKCRKFLKSNFYTYLRKITGNSNLKGTVIKTKILVAMWLEYERISINIVGQIPSDQYRYTFCRHLVLCVSSYS